MDGSGEVKGKARETLAFWALVLALALAVDPARLWAQGAGCAGTAMQFTSLDRWPSTTFSWAGTAGRSWPGPSGRCSSPSPPRPPCLVYTPPGQPFFCVEPVSHVTDAFNLAAAGQPDTGMRTLQPGEGLDATVILTAVLP
jgi:hypothetical protein